MNWIWGSKEEERRFRNRLGWQGLSQWTEGEPKMSYGTCAVCFIAYKKTHTHTHSQNHGDRADDQQQYRESKSVGVRGRKRRHMREREEWTSSASDRRGGSVQEKILSECVSLHFCRSLCVCNHYKALFLASVKATNSKNHSLTQRYMTSRVKIIIEKAHIQYLKCSSQYQHNGFTQFNIKWSNTAKCCIY